MKKAFCLLIVLFFAFQPLTGTMNGETEPVNTAGNTISVKAEKLNIADNSISSKAVKSLTEYKICVDPGHGGSDSGAEGYDGAGYPDEKDFNLDVGLRLRDILLTDNATVVMTRANDSYVSNQTRCDIANNNNTDIFVSIHCNSSLNENDRGTETFYWANNETSYSVNGKKLAGYVQNEMIKQLDLNDRGIKGDKPTLGYHLDVLQNTTMPAILIYASFISNQTEFNLMNTTGFRQNIAVAIYNGICQYFDRASRNYKSTLYDRKAVSGYADLYWENYNPEYADYSASGGDCANFVSQCMIAGGLSLWQGRDGNGANVDEYGTMPFCDYLHEQLVKYQNASYSYIEYSGTPPDYLTAGDVIIYGDASDEASPDYWRHAVIVVEGSGINCKVSGHTTDRYHVSWDYAFPSSFNRTNFYHLTDKTINEYSEFELNKTTSGLNVRVGPATSYGKIGVIDKNQRYIAYEYVINATGKKWWHFWFDDRPAWCAAWYTTEVNENTTFKVNVDGYLNVRDGPGTGYNVVDKIFDGDVFVAFDKMQGGGYIWYNFWWNGSSAWCASNYTTVIDFPLRSVAGWIVYWDDNSTGAFKNNVTVFDEISPFWYDANSDGSITALSGAGNQSLVSFAHNHSVKIMPLISNEYDKDIVHSIISDPVNMSRHINNITDLVITNDYDGIDIDYEGMYAYDKENFTVFVRNLSVTLHEKHKSLSVTVQAKWSDSCDWDGPGAMDYKNLSRYADKMRIMAYDEHWSTSEPGPIASIDWVEKIVNYAVRRCSREKIVLGVPNYGRDWWKKDDGNWTSKAYTYNGIINLINSEGASRQWNDTAKVPYFEYTNATGVNHTVYYEDNESLGYKLDMVSKYKISGICIWRLGNEDQNNWGMIEKKFSIGKTSSVYLKEGWNFISLSLNASYSAETLAKNIENCTHISKWDSTIQNFTIYKRKSYISDFEIEKNKGYLIYVSSSTFFCVAGKKFSNVTINLKVGWNSIGWHNFTKTKAENLGQNITNCTAVAYWNVTLSRFIVHPVSTDIS
ncbi:MAG: N-acetylmuramoyl-L-alanine amidase, partial [Thermoplasmatales archaeon]|nr:N-acetylmuramoyl-L-alanine amidase [Thermoplasmatales archaeon]